MFSSPYAKKALARSIKIAILSSFTSVSLNVLAIEAQQDSSILAEQANKTQQLQTITLQATQENSSSENSKSYTHHQAKTATKLDLALRETPQNVKVYTKEYLDDRNITSFQSLMNNITGVTASRTDERQNNYARGFAVDYYLIDGLPSTMSLGEGDLDLSIFDRVEVVKGANGLMTGAGNPAMGLNMIRKHADSKELTGTLQASGGSWDNYSSSIDLSSGLNEDGSFRGRVFVKHSDEDSFMDHYEKSRNIAYVALDYDVTDSTSFSLAATYQELERNGIRWGGMPAFYTDGTKTHFDRDLTVTSDWTYWNIDTQAVFASLKQNLFNDINLNVAYAYRRDDKDTALLYFGGKVDKATGLGNIKASTYSSRATTEENNVDVYVNMPFSIANREQEILIGGSWNRNELLKSYYGNPVIDNYILDFNDLDTSVVGSISTTNRLSPYQTTQSGAYVAGKFSLLDRLKMVAGARLSNWEYEIETGTGSREFKDELTPYIGFVYDVLPEHSLYASYTDIFKPQNNRTPTGDYLDPILGKNYETGFKSEFFDGRLNTALSIFRIEQSNVAEKIDGQFVETSKTEQAYRAVDGVVSKGFEFEVDGEISEQWAVNLGIANFEAKDAKGTKVNTDNARTMANLFVKYMQNQWNAGIGLNYRSQVTSGTGATKIEQGDIVLASAMLGYQVDPNIKVQLNIDNLFDKTYYEGIGANRMNYGAPRNATLSVQYKF